jgi:hypothetical protein
MEKCRPTVHASSKIQYSKLMSNCCMQGNCCGTLASSAPVHHPVLVAVRDRVHKLPQIVRGLLLLHEQPATLQRTLPQAADLLRETATWIMSSSSSSNSNGGGECNELMM